MPTLKPSKSFAKLDTKLVKHGREIDRIPSFLWAKLDVPTDNGFDRNLSTICQLRHPFPHSVIDCTILSQHSFFEIIEVGDLDAQKASKVCEPFEHHIHYFGRLGTF